MAMAMATQIPVLWLLCPLPSSYQRSWPYAKPFEVDDGRRRCGGPSEVVGAPLSSASSSSSLSRRTTTTTTTTTTTKRQRQRQRIVQHHNKQPHYNTVARTT